MIRLLRGALPALLALAANAAAGASQTVPSPYRYIDENQSLSVYAGFLNPSRAVAVNDSTRVDLGPKAGPMFGLRYALRVGGPLSVEAHVGVAAARRDLYSGDFNADSTRVTITPTGEDISAPLLLTEAAVRFHLTGDRTYRGFAPFVLGSVGLVVELEGKPAAEDSIPATQRFDLGPAFAVGAGAGLDYFTSPRFSLRGELTYRLWKTEPPNGLLVRTVRQESVWKGNAGVSVGGAYHF